MLCTQAQVGDSTNIVPKDTADFPLILRDSLNSSQFTSGFRPDSAQTVVDNVSKNTVATTVKYTAKDSIITDFATNKVFLYGEAKIDYGDIQLEADLIEIDWNTSTLNASSRLDSLGKPISKPVFTDAGQTYVTEGIKYNFKTQKARISGVVTEQEQGFIHGGVVKKNDRDELFLQSGLYTTCNLEEPHYHFAAKKLKVIPGNKVVAGPFNLNLGGVPLPIGLPFGLFPQPREKASGILFPTYGEEARRGFFLQNGGYYFAISDYIDLAIRGSIFTSGSNSVSAASTYRKRYKYSGRFNIDFTNTRTGIEGDSSSRRDIRINWSHTPQSRGNSRFSASVNAQTGSFNTNNPGTVAQNINQQFSSNLTYSLSIPNTPISISANARHQQVVTTGVVNLTLPDVNVSARRINPFKKRGSSGNKWYEQINLSYTSSISNRISNQQLPNFNFDVANESPLSDSVLAFSGGNFSSILNRSQFGIRHRIPISTSFKLLKNFTFTPSFNYEEIWYFRQLQYEFIPEQNAVQVDTIPGFVRAPSYNVSGGVSTQIFGFVYFKKGKIQAIRHVITPSVSFSYSPDFSSPRFGNFQDVQVDNEGNTQRLSRFQGFLFGTPSAGPNAALSFSIQNNLEAKIKTKTDSTSDTKKIQILDNFSISGSYNFLADSFNLSNFNVSGRTTLFDRKINLSFTATLDPYRFVLDTSFVNTQGSLVVQQTRVNQFRFTNGEGLAQITSFRLSINTNLNSKARGRDIVGQQQEAQFQDQQLFEAQIQNDPTLGEEDKEQLIAQAAEIYNNPNEYVDFSIPWNFRIRYSFGFNGQGFQEKNITQSVSFSGDFNLSDKWKIDFSSGYDFQNRAFTQTNIGVVRDLHCWQLNFDWTPFGRFQRYEVNVAVRASILQDLKINRRSSIFDNRSQSF